MKVSVISTSDRPEIEGSVSIFASLLIQEELIAVYSHDCADPSFDLSWSCFEIGGSEALAIRVVNRIGRPILCPGMQDLMLSLLLERCCVESREDAIPVICNLPFPVPAIRSWSFQLLVKDHQQRLPIHHGGDAFVELATERASQIASVLSLINIRCSTRSELPNEQALRGRLLFPLPCSLQTFREVGSVAVPLEQGGMSATICLVSASRVLHGRILCEEGAVSFSYLGDAMTKTENEQEAGIPLSVELGTIELSARSVATLRPGDVLRFDSPHPFLGVLRAGDQVWASVELELGDEVCSIRIVDLLQLKSEL